MSLMFVTSDESFQNVFLRMRYIGTPVKCTELLPRPSKSICTVICNGELSEQYKEEKSVMDQCISVGVFAKATGADFTLKCSLARVYIYVHILSLALLQC